MSRFRLRADRLAWLVLGASIGSAFADANDRRIYVTPMFSYSIADDNRATKDGIGGTIAVGKRILESLELEARGTFSDYSGKNGNGDTKLYGIGGGANLFPAPTSDLLGGLYLHLDVLYGKGRNEPGTAPNYKTTIFDAGLGYEWLLTKEAVGPFAPGIALRAEALYRNDGHGHNLNGGAPTTHRSFQEPMLNIGLRIPLGGRAVATASAPAPAEETPAVVPVADAAPPAEAPPPAPPPPPCQPPEPGKPVDLSGCHTGDTLVLHGVNFDFNKATLTANAKTLLDMVVDALKAHPEIKVEVDGHTDGKGTDAYNLKLSDARAKSVMKYLVGHGVAADHLSAKGFGKTMPIADNGTDEGREQNRRVELKIIDDGKGGAAPADAAPAAAAPPPAEATPAPAAEAAPAAADAPTADAPAATPDAGPGPAEVPPSPDTPPS